MTPAAALDELRQALAQLVAARARLATRIRQREQELESLRRNEAELSAEEARVRGLIANAEHRLGQE